MNDNVNNEELQTEVNEEKIVVEEKRVIAEPKSFIMDLLFNSRVASFMGIVLFASILGAGVYGSRSIGTYLLLSIPIIYFVIFIFIQIKKLVLFAKTYPKQFLLLIGVVIAMFVFLYIRYTK